MASKKTTKSAPAKKSTTRQAPSKADFIRQHPNLSVKDLIATAEKAGLKLSENYIYTLRSEAKKKSAADKGKKKTSAAVKTQPTVAKKPTPKGAPPSKADFIRKHPGLRATELVATGKKAGVKFNANYVYTLRSADNQKKTAPSKVGMKSTRAAPKGLAKPSGSLEETFIAAILELGATRAQELFESTLSRVRGLAHHK